MITFKYVLLVVQIDMIILYQVYQVTLSTVSEPIIAPAVPDNDDRQFANAAPFVVKPIPPSRNVPKNETAITPLKLTVTLRRTEK